MPRYINEYILYRWRYSIGYILVGLLVSILLIAATFYVPGGLSASEMASTVTSNNVSLQDFGPATVIDLPYTLLQHACFALLGITTLSIKLPSLLLGLLSLLGIILLLRHWFHMNVAVISALIVITTSQFIFASQDGTPGIMYVVLPTWLLLLALKVSRQNNQKRSFWEFLLVAVAALSLYTPLSIYVIIALGSATLLHPHLRFIVGRLSRRKLLAAGVVGVALLAPLVIALALQPSVGLTLLGIPETWPSLYENVVQLIETHLGFLLPNKKDMIQPMYTLPSILMMLLGIMHLFKTRHTARSYIITSWLVLLTPIIVLNPEKTTITFVPVMLLIAAGIEELLHRWYSLFPRNPYARVAGLFPITLLVIGMALTGIERYFYTYRYSPSAANGFTSDLKLLSDEVSRRDDTPVTLLTSAAEFPFYGAVAKRNATITAVSLDDQLTPGEEFIVTRDGFYEHEMNDAKPIKVITNGKKEKSDRLYLYKTAEE